MEKINLPKGLIRYASEENIVKKAKFTFTPRLKGYTAVLTILTGIFIGMLFLRNDLEANILRLPGQLYERKEGNIISNVYTYKLINKTNKEITDVSFKLLSHPGSIEVVTGKRFDVPAQELSEGTLFIEINNSGLEGDKDQLEIGVYSGEDLIETTSARFWHLVLITSGLLKRRNMKLNWGFGIVLAFIGFIGFILYFVIIASTDQKAEHNLVTDEYYQEELKYQEEINALENAKNLNVRFNFEQTTEGLRIIIPETVRQQKSEGTVSLYRPSNKQLDFDLAISLCTSGQRGRR